MRMEMADLFLVATIWRMLLTICMQPGMEACMLCLSFRELSYTLSNSTSQDLSPMAHMQKLKFVSASVHCWNSSDVARHLSLIHI